MKSGRTAAALWLLLVTAAPARAAAEPSPGRRIIAVLDFSPINVDPVDATVVTQFVRSAIVRTGAFSVVDKGNMDKILAEQTFQQTGCVSQECAIRLGRLLNVQAILIGNFGRFKGGWVIWAQIVDVETGRILASETEQLDEVSGAADAAVRIAALLAEVAGGSPPRIASSALVPEPLSLRPRPVHRPVEASEPPATPAPVPVVSGPAEEHFDPPGRAEGTWKWLGVGGLLAAAFLVIAAVR